MFNITALIMAALSIVAVMNMFMRVVSIMVVRLTQVVTNTFTRVVSLAPILSTVAA